MNQFHLKFYTCHLLLHANLSLYLDTYAIYHI